MHVLNPELRPMNHPFYLQSPRILVIINKDPRGAVRLEPVKPY